MTQAKSVDQKDPSEQRTVLLATDGSQSIIGEVVDGKAKSIAYSPYGEQSVQQKVETRLGFNGQVREANIGWYLLGNGYRAYNPRLMRFHSPDSWSPFGRGGLNAYMYCVGDPVNRSDPTGHSVLGAMYLASRDLAKQFQSPNYRAGPPLPKIDTTVAANASRALQQSRTFEKTHGMTAITGAISYAAGPKPKVSWSNDGGDFHGSQFSSNLFTPPPSGSWIVSSRGSTPTAPVSRTLAHTRIRPRPSFFKERRTLYQGPSPQNYRPPIEHMTLLGGSASTANTRLVSRTSTSVNNPTLHQYRAAGNNGPGNGWVTDNGPNGYQNIQVRSQRQRNPVENNPSEPGPSSRIRRDG